MTFAHLFVTSLICNVMRAGLIVAVVALTT